MGPDDFDMDGEVRAWGDRITELVGPTPNIACYGRHSKWILRHMEVLLQYQERYRCKADFTTLFVEHLVQCCCFQRWEYREVKLI